MATRSISLSNFNKSTLLIQNSFEKILKSVQELETLSPSILSVIQIRTLNNFSNQLEKKHEAYENYLERALEHISEELDLDAVSDTEDKLRLLFVEAKSRIEALLQQQPQDVPEESKDSTRISDISASSSAHVRLPKLDLITFDGSPLQWVSFINLFDTSIHLNESISNVTKFQYLLSVLKNEPLNLVKAFSITSANYSIAYQLLRDRYHNTRRLTTLHLNKLIDLPDISSTSNKCLRTFLNLFYEHTEALKALDCDITSNSNPLLSTILLRKLDNDLLKQLEAFRINIKCETHSLPEVVEIVKFLNQECNQMEDAVLHTKFAQSTNNHNSNFKPKSFTSKPSFIQAQKVTMVSTPTPSNQDNSKNPFSFPCFVCSSTGHKVYACPSFLSLSSNERFKTVKDNNRCVSCLGKHDVKACKSKASCFKCHKRHHTLLHFEHDKTSQGSTSSQPSTTHVSNEKPTVSLCSQEASPANQIPKTVILGTTLVKVTAQNNVSHVFRALIDSGSMCDFISEKAAQLLNAPRFKSNLQVVGLSQSPTLTKGIVNLTVNTLAGKLVASNHEVHILDKISVNLPRSQISQRVLLKVKPYPLADPSFHLSGPIDMLIGASLFPLLLTNENYSLGPNMPNMMGTHFGFVVMGNAPCSTDSQPANTPSISLLSTVDNELHNSLQKFWKLEELSVPSKISVEEQQCEDLFKATHSRDENGRYLVQLPFKENHPPLGSSKLIAERRFHSLERRFTLSPDLYKAYSDNINEHISQGHMVKLPHLDINSPHYFLPHHAVVKPSSTSTKLRIVYDASCKTSSGISLNDSLMTGPKLQTNICDILLHFRIHNIVFTCDIRQMYLQILIKPSDQLFQLVLWRDNPSEDISTYKLTRVTFGVNSSPYLAIRTLHQLAEDEGKDFPEAANVLRTQTYVDDIVTGADTVDEAKNLQNQLIQLLNRGHFELRKWTSNSPELLQSLPDTHKDSPVFLENTPDPHFSILGLHWSPDSDNFSFHLNLPPKTLTKRHVLSLVAKIYDPCGFLSPCTMTAKCFIQLLWTTGLQWDEPLTPELSAIWSNFISAIPALADIQIPRALKISPNSSVELHGFSDASERGFSAVVYVRCSQPNGEVTTLTLTWLQTPSYRLKTFVANRVAQTQELVPYHCWRYIPSKENPADCASRGILATELVSHPLWWSGPSWLSLPPSNWPDVTFSPTDISTLDEVKHTPLTVLVSTTTESTLTNLLIKYSSWERLLRIFAYVLRFIHNCKDSEKRQGFISTQELKDTKYHIFKLVQKEVFTEEINCLKRKSFCSTRLQRLSPFIDSFGLLRVGGRLSQTSLPEDARHPIILPKKHHVVNLLIDHYHIYNLHSGPQLTQALLYKHVWILSARCAIRSRIHKCVRCFKVKPRNVCPLMADLPQSRVTPARPFLHTGIDYAGPFTVKIFNLKAVRHIKSYFCTFICLVTKAVHLEVVTDLTTESFIAAMTRFVSRRGHSSDIYSDCGSNFIGADSTLSKIVEKSLYCQDSKRKIQRFSSLKGINFHFNPPAAPHQGGLWESSVKNVKHYLRRVMGNSVLTLIEFITLLTQIEAMLNSRPLTPLSNDPSDLAALTPGHFLIGAPLTAVPEPNLLTVPENRLKQWQLVQAFHQRIWHRWHLEYLNNLQQRTKWTRKSKNLEVGDLVLVHMDSPPLSWPLARITAVHPGADGVVRVIDLKTSSGNLRRSAHKVFPLPTVDS
ncbi:uncharacterized protein LOC128984179 [Macrosteles quadrilineatus]|uniref:uncharacterized protein LOC128984179 n=1 Tax=Macrosteles quadrilineatus TaxID=74068 RepID=UPI0023E2FE33|nr:uncharacterized protein LOC128984179 [Macrosteles quadrilineatus]